MPDLSTVSARTKLKPRRDPYWQKLGKYRYIGFRKMAVSSSGSWVARYQEPGGKRVQRALGDCSSVPKHSQYDAAKREAESWFVHLDQGGAVVRITLRGACEAYADALESKGESGKKSADDVRRRFSQYVFNDPRFAGKELGKLTRNDLMMWRRRLATEITKTGAVRKASTLNRDMTCLRAALNFSLDQGWTNTDAAWRNPLKPVSVQENPDVAGRRKVYLSLAERRRLVASAPPDLQAFIKAMCLLPLRPGALANLRVDDFNKLRASLSVSVDKAGRGRVIPLPPDAAALISSQCKSKLPGALIFCRTDGVQWTKENWKKPLRTTARKALLGKDVVMYTLRHSAITDMVCAGVPLLTVGQLAGTSVRMIERHYGHLRQDKAFEALLQLKL